MQYNYTELTLLDLSTDEKPNGTTRLVVTTVA